MGWSCEIVGIILDWCPREVMDSLLCWRLFGWIETDATLLQLGLASGLEKLTTTSTVRLLVVEGPEIIQELLIGTQRAVNDDRGTKKWRRCTLNTHQEEEDE
jgi:hypothetical protein